MPASPSDRAMPPTRARRPGRRPATDAAAVADVAGAPARPAPSSVVMVEVTAGPLRPSTAAGAGGSAARSRRSRRRSSASPTSRRTMSAERSVGDDGRPGQVQSGHHPRRRRGPGRVDGEVEREVRRGRVDADLGQPARRRHPAPSRDPSAGRRAATPVAGALWSRIQAVVAGRRRQQRRPMVGQEVDVGIDPLGGGLAERQDAQRDPRVVGRDRDVDRRPVTDRLAALRRRRPRRTPRRGRSASARRRSRGPRVRRAGAGSRGRSPTGRRRRTPPRRTVMSRASMRTFMSSSAGPPAASAATRTRRGRGSGRSRGRGAGASSRRPSRRSTGPRAAASATRTPRRHRRTGTP